MLIVIEPMTNAHRNVIIHCCYALQLCITFYKNYVCHIKPCITMSEVFHQLCLVPHNLRAACEHRAEYLMDRTPVHDVKHYRHTAYRQYIYYAYGWLGPRKRQALLGPFVIFFLLRAEFIKDLASQNSRALYF